jgi:hypothetical protein
MSGSRTRIFVSYSSADVSWLERLQVHLKPLERAGLIEWWAYTRDLLAGQVWEDEIKKALAAAHIGVLLVSADFVASDFIAKNELPPLLAAAQDRGLTILSLIVGPSQFENMPELSRFQAVNPPSQPLIGLSKAGQEDVLLKLANRIRGLAGSTTPATRAAPTTAAPSNPPPSPAPAITIQGAKSRKGGLTAQARTGQGANIQEVEVERDINVTVTPPPSNTPPKL